MPKPGLGNEECVCILKNNALPDFLKGVFNYDIFRCHKVAQERLLPRAIMPKFTFVVRLAAIVCFATLLAFTTAFGFAGVLAVAGFQMGAGSQCASRNQPYQCSREHTFFI
ncbi:MAG: hypothetical protein KDD76_05515 [Rickettsiales bacterium]|nr:hypothetical protein [Rickettsiales bacterium]